MAQDYSVLRRDLLTHLLGECLLPGGSKLATSVRNRFIENYCCEHLILLLSARLFLSPKSLPFSDSQPQRTHSAHRRAEVLELRDHGHSDLGIHSMHILPLAVPSPSQTSEPESLEIAQLPGVPVFVKLSKFPEIVEITLSITGRTCLPRPATSLRVSERRDLL